MRREEPSPPHRESGGGKARRNHSRVETVFLYTAAEAINELDVAAYIYHLGDFDPSGVNAGEKIEETLYEMAPDAEIYFERIAVTPEQIAAWALPTRPT